MSDRLWQIQTRLRWAAADFRTVIPAGWFTFIRPEENEWSLGSKCLTRTNRQPPPLSCPVAVFML